MGRAQGGEGGTNQPAAVWLVNSTPAGLELGLLLIAIAATPADRVYISSAVSLAFCVWALLVLGTFHFAYEFLQF